MQLVWPSAEHVPSYVAALERGWAADNSRGAASTREELDKIHEDPAAFIESMVDREARGGPIRMPDGTTVARNVCETQADNAELSGSPVAQTAHLDHIDFEVDHFVSDVLHQAGDAEKR